MESLDAPPLGASHLRGRAADLAVLASALDRIRDRGTAAVLVGEAGIGKTALLDAARDGARSRGFQVAATAGVERESALPFSGLHRLLQGMLRRDDRLPAAQRDVLRAAFGLTDDGSADLFRIALAALGLVEAEAGERPLLLLVDDLHWIDEASRDVITFIGRRIEADPIVLLAAVRDSHRAQMRDLALPVQSIGPLDGVAARTLLDDRAPTLTSTIRARLLAAAAGNPLALTELPISAGGGRARDAGLLPMTERLERAFADRLTTLPPDARSLLLVFAADADAPMADVLAAGEALTGRPLDVGALQPALDARLVGVDGGELRFRHPLVRSAVYQEAQIHGRRAAHAALAKVVAGQPDRRAHHRAAAAIGPDDEVADELEAMALRAARRGAVLHAATSLARAADLSTDPRAMMRRVLDAAELAFEAGRADMVRELVEQSWGLPGNEQDRARAAWLAEIFHDGADRSHGDSERVSHLHGLGLQAADEDDLELALKLLGAAAIRCWWGGSDPDVRRRVADAVRRLDVPETDSRRIGAIAMAEPLAAGDEVIALIREAGPSGAAEPSAAFRLGLAAHAVAEYGLSLRLLAQASDGLRDEGRLALLAQAGVMLSVGGLIVGDWATAEPAAAEAAALAEETAQPIWRAGAMASLGALAGVRGDDERADVLIGDAAEVLGATGSGAVMAWLQTARGLVALSAGRYEDAFAELLRIFDPNDPAYHLRDQFAGVAYFADAAVNCDQHDAARRIVASLRSLAATTSADGIWMGLEYADAVLAPDDEAGEAIGRALTAAWSTHPFERARLHLAHGMWLRRRRRVVESREPLRLARSAFDALNAPPWSERARQELRAAGEGSTGRRREAWDELSPQELQIAQLAAAGLSNRAIGQRLYLSHRTVASHLYRAFPKLGITSRTQLASALPASGTLPGEPG